MENNETFFEASPDNFDYKRRIAEESQNHAKPIKQSCVNAFENAEKSLKTFDYLKKLEKFERQDDELYQNAQKILISYKK